MCGRRCAMGEACIGGVCMSMSVMCMAPLVACAGQCRNIQTDSTNCGSCGNMCPLGRTCAGGRCS
jgi:hypothetical protein